MMVWPPIAYNIAATLVNVANQIFTSEQSCYHPFSRLNYYSCSVSQSCFKRWRIFSQPVEYFGQTSNFLNRFTPVAMIYCHTWIFSPHLPDFIFLHKNKPMKNILRGWWFNAVEDKITTAPDKLPL